MLEAANSPVSMSDLAIWQQLSGIQTTQFREAADHPEDGSIN